jgi:hypothetical protein
VKSNKEQTRIGVCIRLCFEYSVRFGTQLFYFFDSNARHWGKRGFGMQASFFINFLLDDLSVLITIEHQRCFWALLAQLGQSLLADLRGAFCSVLSNIFLRLF